jgi:hypothetical protein
MYEFKFGFVIPGSTNTWEHIIDVDENPDDPEILSGNLVCVTEFYDGKDLISRSRIRIFYVEKIGIGLEKAKG